LKDKVTLQISLAPGDLPHAKYLLKHQLNILSSQVDEVILTVDTKSSKGRFGEGWAAYQQPFNDFLKNEILPNYPVRIIPVDYSTEARCKVAAFFSDLNDLPGKDFRGGPFYAYFFGLYSAAHDMVLHLDSDMFLGGRSRQWVSEAAALLQSSADIFIVSPLPGPPHADDILVGQPVMEKTAPHTFRIAGMSTRIFMIDRSGFKSNKLHITKPGFRSQVKAIVERNPNADLPENLLSCYMLKNNLKRIDFLGSGTGMWSLHPPYRSPQFYRDLPHIIKQVETNDLPPQQYGYYDIVDEVCDWSEAREKIKHNRWWKRLFNK
jgi:hypothetical protein